MKPVYAAIVLAVLAVWPTDVTSCIGPPLGAVFTADLEPFELDSFARGDLGILRTKYHRRYLIIAYRYLTGVGLADDQREALIKPKVMPAGWLPPENEWTAARNAVPGHSEIHWLNTYRFHQNPYRYFRNCNEDSFSKAKDHLQVLIRKHGASSERVKEWLTAQDLVFANCAGEQGPGQQVGPAPGIPAALPPSADPEARADRQYQIAAAHFYSEEYAVARQQFEAIGKDRSSPWQPWGPYLAARASIRDGDFRDAERRLKEILADSQQRDMQERAGNLLQYVGTRLDAEGTMVTVAAELESPHPKDIQQLVWDYDWLHTSLNMRKDHSLSLVASKDDLTDWLDTFHGPGEIGGCDCEPPRPQADVKAHSVERWSTTQKAHWLIAALYFTTAKDAEFPALREAADRLPRSSPAYLSAQYYATLSLLRTGKEDAAVRERLTALLKNQWPNSARNQLLAARMKLATTWEEFLRDSQRSPTPSWGISYRKPETDLKAPTFDFDGAYILRFLTPLDTLAATAARKSLPPGIRRNLAIAAWTRAVMLGRSDMAHRLSPLVSSLVPEAADELAEFEKSQGESARFAAAYTMLRNPGFHPYPEAGYGRMTRMDKIDELRDNWWCTQPAHASKQWTANPYFFPNTTEGPAIHEIYGDAEPSAPFFTAKQKETAEKEREDLSQVSAGPSYLGKISLRWAAGHPDDPRAPESLYLVVKATRFGCADGETADVSRRAFQLLHKRYPDSEWAKQTKYWYKG